MFRNYVLFLVRSNNDNEQQLDSESDFKECDEKFSFCFSSTLFSSASL
jgi:hypothetical protein